MKIYHAIMFLLPVCLWSVMLEAKPHKQVQKSVQHKEKQQGKHVTKLIKPSKVVAPPLDLNVAYHNELLHVYMHKYKTSQVKKMPLKSLYQPEQEELRFVFIVPSYNNAAWYKKNLASIFSQHYANYHVIYIDDASTDGTPDLVAEFVKQEGREKQVTLVRNQSQKRMAHNRYAGVHLCADTDICLALDGDDWMPHENVLSLYNKLYKNKNVWLTYGHFQVFPSGKEENDRQIDRAALCSNTIRKHPWVSSHFKTFYAWLFKQIDEESFKKDGKFLRSATDLAMMFPMIEMAGLHTRYVRQLTYIYNRAPALIEGRQVVPDWHKNGAHLREQMPYTPIAIW